MSSEPTFQLFTSVRYDPLLLTSLENSRPDLNFIAPSPFYMLTYHRVRMLEAAQHFDFEAVAKRLEDGEALHKELLKRVDEWKRKEGKDEPLKLRVLFDKEANMTVELAPTPPVLLSTLYPTSFDPPNQAPTPHPADTSFQPSPLTGGALTLGPTDSLPATPSAPQWALRLDTAPTAPSSFTLLKTTKREMYDSSRSRALPPNPAHPGYCEVMLYNKVNELTEGSITSLYLYRGGRWVTPPVGVPSAYRPSDEDEGELREPFAGRWGHSIRSAKVGAGGQRGTSRRWALGQGFCMEEPVGIDTVRVGEGVWVSSGVRGFGFGRVVECSQALDLGGGSMHIRLLNSKLSVQHAQFGIPLSTNAAVTTNRDSHRGPAPTDLSAFT
ncbi:hypothetical protein CC86DRAFT_451944 [Ophiobolus disseminans]|uniref:Uncharacterized protein n=1 Tax=Ophiobolus disseminans TaxID=1469910 RepID=A0A6A7AGK3_9PLEO|nr:hypothetical protein CC86DRAFT_451944 [Ophiobolus disseminans]